MAQQCAFLPTAPSPALLHFTRPRIVGPNVSRPWSAPQRRCTLVRCTTQADTNGTPGASNEITAAEGGQSDRDPTVGGADVDRRIVALEERLRSVSHAAALRDELLGRVADAVAVALTADAAAAVQTAIAAASDARARAETVQRALASTKDRAAERIAHYSRELESARSAVVSLEQRVQFLANSVSEKDRQLRERASASPDLDMDVVDPEAGAIGYCARPLTSPSEVRACLASLLIYPSLAQLPEDILPSNTSPANRFATGGRDAPVPDFHVALLRFLELLAPFTVSASPSDSSLSSATFQLDRTRVVAAYGTLWRSVALPGRIGWRGEIIRAVLSRAHPQLVADAQLTPLARRAFAADLRKLQALFITPPLQVSGWLCANVGLSQPPLTLPDYISGRSPEDPDGSRLASSVVSVTSSISLPAEEETQEMIAFLSNVPDWGCDDAVTRVLASITDGPSKVSSLADGFYGLRWTANGLLEGILSAEDVASMPVRQFVGVEHIRDRLCQNCEFLLNGLTASNVHMYGPPGCGKSSCVMSLLKEFGPRGLRIIEVTKETLGTLPDIFDAISGLRQNFIIFIDDLTFEESESETMRIAKAALEGSLRLNPTNVFVLCTSNRRFPVGSQLTDATEEKLAFSYRFGIILAFPRTSRADYLRIVHALAEERNIVMGETEMDDLALKWALGQDGNANSLSGRTARQFVDYVASAQALYGGGAEDLLKWSGNKNATAIPANSRWTSE
jgi:predicted AAA+ superfamily ATPase